MGSDEDRSTNLGARGEPGAPLPVLRSDLIHRPGDGTCSQRLLSIAVRPRYLSLCYAAAAALPAMKWVPSTNIRCRTTASLRASATLALRIPARMVRRMAQLFSNDPFPGRVRMTLVAS